MFHRCACFCAVVNIAMVFVYDGCLREVSLPWPLFFLFLCWRGDAALWLLGNRLSEKADRFVSD